ncbi:hypothetical protein [Actinophytocola algeriensis]|uniref:Uncharacterized protein n=1 Tax=Actinophytocola algeriensis TaxID=1768010 RepID=A0A7W7QG29_9PSEU|nr:hypothetical protein [Actinophytocola algeriensis]MBB4912758.1 hypothetical protein [Actinophytocola algeriensis]MBE1473574.1 hypothetical protein [Actinophytocola algeriensis]
MRPKRAVASFDSASTFHRVLAQHLHGSSSPALGLGPAARAVSRLLPLVNHMPLRVREALYIWSGWSEAVQPSRVGMVDTDAIAEWACSQYPRGQYPAVLVGSSSGAVAHLAALAGIPWLPQTFLVPVRHHGLDPDDPAKAVTELADARDAFTEANPGVALHHMHDANQDRLMIRRMGYFRFKYQQLPDAYREFLRENLAPGGTVVVTDCTERWPTTATGSRQVFQHGAVGDATAEEYAKGGPRVAEFLAEQGAERRAWDPPPADGDSPEAEWGFDPALLGDLEDLCRAEDRRLDRLTFPRADALSGPVAELYRSWYAEQGTPADRLLVSCFAVIDAHLPLARGLVPYWTLFGTCAARDTLEKYVREAEPYDEIHLGLFSHGTCSIGRAGIEDWDRVLGHARRHGAYCGADTDAYPQDFASNGRFHRAAAALPEVPVLPGTAPWDWVRERLTTHEHPAVGYTTVR